MSEQALVPQYINQIDSTNKLTYNLACLLTGLFLLCALAQISIHLPWTPVPITGQTFGVALIAMLWGFKRGFAIVSSYLFIGALGAPVFAAGKSGLVWGPTLGYLIGMLIASVVMGYLSDRGWTKTFARTYVVGFVGSVITFFFGALVLSYFIPAESLFIAGVLPFIPGDIAKTALASLIVSRLNDRA